MSLDADLIVDRRRLRRSLTVWRVVAVLAVIAAIGIAAVLTFTRDGTSGRHVARVEINGIIRGDAERTKLFEKIAESENALALIVEIDSPGGTVAGSEELYDAIRRVAAKKPVVAVVDGLAASGGYIAALGADQVVARGSSLVGSIGVLVQYPNVAELLRSLGVKMEEVKSTPLKAAPNGFEPTSPEARAALEVIVRDNYDWFRGLVRDRRQITGAELDRVADGRVFTGRQAAELRLIDRLGDAGTARDWLAESRSIARTTPVKTWKVRERLADLGFLHLMAHAIADAAGLTALAERIAGSGAVTTLDRLGLDGVLAVWHPPTSP